MSTWVAVGYWGIVTGLALLVAIFFACMEILYRYRAPNLAEKAESPAEQGQQASAGGRHAA